MDEDRYFEYVSKVKDLYEEKELNIYLMHEEQDSGKRINTKLPFFAYGFLKEDEIGFGVIKPYVANKSTSIVNNYKLYLKDGLPVAVDDCNESISGQLISFKSTTAAEQAYTNIAIMTIGGLYSWKEITNIHGNSANMLVLNPMGSDNEERLKSLFSIEFSMWDKNTDFFFINTMNFLKKEYFNKFLNYNTKNIMGNRLKTCIVLQMVYMELWTIIDRFCAMSCWVDNRRVLTKARMLAKYNNEFMEAIQRFEHKFLSKGIENVYRSFNGEAVSFTEDNLIQYYYTIRCNAVHRGKGPSERDINILRFAFLDLFAIMWAVIRNDYSLIDIIKVKNS